MDLRNQHLTAVTSDSEFQEGAAYVEQSIGSLLRVVRELLDLEVMFVGEFMSGTRVFRRFPMRAEDAVAKVGEGHPLDRGVCQFVADGRMPKARGIGFRVGLRDGRLPTCSRGEGAYAEVPVRSADGGFYGVLCGFRLGSRDFDDRDINRLELAANGIARLLAQADGVDVNLQL